MTTTRTVVIKSLISKFIFYFKDKKKGIYMQMPFLKYFTLLINLSQEYVYLDNHLDLIMASLLCNVN